MDEEARVQGGGDQLTIRLQQVTKVDLKLACLALKPGLLTNFR